jgi:hypothetical protein
VAPQTVIFSRDAGRRSLNFSLKNAEINAEIRLIEIQQNSAFFSEVQYFCGFSCS